MNTTTQGRRTWELGHGGEPLGFEAGDANLYRYCDNDPTDATDPSGLSRRRAWEGSVPHTLRRLRACNPSRLHNLSLASALGFSRGLVTFGLGNGPYAVPFPAK